MVTEFPREACLHHSQDDCDAGSLSLSETLSLNCFFFFFPVLFFFYYHTHGKWGLKQHCYGSWVLTFIQGRVRGADKHEDARDVMFSPLGAEIVLLCMKEFLCYFIFSV